MKTTILGLALAAGTVVFGAPVAAQEPPVEFADPNLRAAVEEALGVSDPTPGDMLGLTELRRSFLPPSCRTRLKDSVSISVNDLQPRGSCTNDGNAHPLIAGR